MSSGKVCRQFHAANEALLTANARSGALQDLLLVVVTKFFCRWFDVFFNTRACCTSLKCTAGEHETLQAPRAFDGALSMTKCASQKKQLTIRSWWAVQAMCTDADRRVISNA